MRTQRGLYVDGQPFLANLGQVVNTTHEELLRSLLQCLYKTDSTMAPPKTSDFLSRTFHSGLLDTTRKDDIIERKLSTHMHFLVCKGLSIDDVGVSRDTVFQEIRPGAGFEAGDFVKEKLGGATAERLIN